MTIPQISVANILSKLITHLRQDHEQAVVDGNPGNSLISRILLPSTLNYGKFNFASEGINLFSQPKTSARFVDVRLGYDLQRAKEPTIHVTLGSETEFFQGVGLSQSFVSGNDPGISTGRMYDANISIVFTSSNQFEVVLMYEVVKHLLVVFADRVELACELGELRISGQDLQLAEPDNVPPAIFARSLSIRGKYESRVDRLQPIDFANITKLILQTHLLP